MKTKKLRPVNKRAKMLEAREVFGMAENIDVMTGMPVGCTTIFDTGWETNPRLLAHEQLCSERQDFASCSGPCWWPAQTPDGITNFPVFRTSAGQSKGTGRI